MSVIIPEGYVLVPRGAGVAAKLLEAADEVGADQVTAVRTITGGYHVLKEVAEAYGVTFTEPEAETEEDAPEKEAPAEEKPEDAPAEPKTTRRTAAKK